MLCSATLECSTIARQKGSKFRLMTVQGDSNSFEYRVFVEEQGSPVSVWHDIPLYAENGLVNMVVEIPKESSAKMEAATVSAKHIADLKTADVCMWICRPIAYNMARAFTVISCISMQSGLCEATETRLRVCF